MLSYRHAFHAGNHADVLKHLVLTQLFAYMNQKEAPWWAIDTHAGAGIYALDTPEAKKLAEFSAGIARLWERSDTPAPVKTYLDLVHALNPGGTLRRYPGSPWIARQMIRPQDRLRLFELHPTDSRHLLAALHENGRQVGITAGDGLAGLKALLPPPTRRAVVLIDPSYEVKSEYGAVVKTLGEAMKRFATGTYAIWYPQLARLEAQQFPARLKAQAGSSWLHVALSVRRPAKDGLGMHGSGLFVVNPNWQLESALQETLPWLVDALGCDDSARYLLESSAAS